MAKTRIGTWNSVPVYTDFLPFGTRRTGQQLNSGNPQFAVAHDTGNPNTTAQQNVNYYKNTFNEPWASVASAHVFVDDKECVICIPITEKAWHVLYNTPIDNQLFGGDANDIAFGVEICYFSDIARSRKSLDNACRIMAALCNSWDVNPRTKMTGHQDIQADKQDPGNLLAACGYNRRDLSVIKNLVVKYMAGDAPAPKKAPATPKPVKKGNELIAKEVVAGKWGNGADRTKRLRAAGYNPDTIQRVVNDLLAGNKKKKPDTTIAKEVIAGKWGNGSARAQKLKAAGYNPDAIQRIVNQFLL